MLSSGLKGVYLSTLLSALPGVEHGFGTRTSESWPGRYASVKQIHSNVVQIAPGEPGLEGDAIITQQPGLWIGVRTADCVPILLADPKVRVVAAVHAGWRGTVDEIVTETVKRLTVDFQCLPENIVAAIGPCISKCCFEVGQEVSERFGKFFPEQEDLRYVDLNEANRRQLAASNVLQVDGGELCTKCSGEQFHSFRRDREQSGRMVAAIRVLPV